MLLNRIVGLFVEVLEFWIIICTDHCSLQRICSYLLKKYLMEKFAFCAVICANNNPKLQNFFKKSKVASKRSEQLRLRFGRVLRSVSAELYSHNIELAFTTNRPARKTRHCGKSKRFSKRYSIYESNLNRHKVW